MDVIRTLLASLGHGLLILLASVLCLGFMPAPVWLRLVTLGLLTFALMVSLRATVTSSAAP